MKLRPVIFDPEHYADDRAAMAVRHDWQKRAEHSIGGQTVRDVHVCSQCGQWTANLPLYRYNVCEAKDRRTCTPDRRSHV